MFSSRSWLRWNTHGRSFTRKEGTSQMHRVVGQSGFLRSTFEEAGSAETRETRSGSPRVWGKHGKTTCRLEGLWPELGVGTFLGKKLIYCFFSDYLILLNQSILLGSLWTSFLHPPCHWDICPRSRWEEDAGRNGTNTGVLAQLVCCFRF